MKKEDKNIIIEEISKEIKKYNHFYLTDISTLNAEQTSDLRRKCFEKEVKLIVVKNTLLKKALEKSEKDFSQIYDVLKDSTSIMFTNVGNSPAKLIKELRKKYNRPLLKAAYVEETFYLGDNQLENLVNIKSKEEVIGDIILLLQSPIKNVILSLKSGGSTLAGIVKTLADKKE